MRLSKPQDDIFFSGARFRAVVAGRRFGKTFLSTHELLRASLSGKNRNCWYVAPTYKAAKEIAWSFLTDALPDGYVSKRNESSLTLTLKNGSTISLKGAEKPDNLRGRALDFVVLDEFADMRPEAWYEVIRPSLSDRHSVDNPTRALLLAHRKGGTISTTFGREARMQRRAGKPFSTRPSRAAMLRRQRSRQRGMT